MKQKLRHGKRQKRRQRTEPVSAALPGSSLGHVRSSGGEHSAGRETPSVLGTLLAAVEQLDRARLESQPFTAAECLTEQPRFTATDWQNSGAALLDQQFWCWGQDVAGTQGNLLLELGFERTGAPVGSKSPSLYRLPLSDGGELVLRGFGLFWGRTAWGGLFQKRCEAEPSYCEQARLPRPLWEQTDLPPLRNISEGNRTAVRLLQQDLFGWIAAYEGWVAERYGLEYRDRSLQRWREKGKQVVTAAQMAACWEQFAEADA